MLRTINTLEKMPVLSDFLEPFIGSYKKTCLNFYTFLSFTSDDYALMSFAKCCPVPLNRKVAYCIKISKANIAYSLPTLG